MAKNRSKESLLKFWIIFILLIVLVVVSYSMPRARYVGSGFISELDIPLIINNWNGKDITDQLNLDFDKDWNKFISEAKITQYVNKNNNNSLLFILLDAGNFHHPNVCFTAAGYSIKELDDSELSVSGRTIKTHTLLTEKDGKNNLSLYWIIIDKNISHKWIEQKIKQLYFSLFNRERVGLMVRFDIPTDEKSTQDSFTIAQQFISELSQKIPQEQADYIFGQN